MSRCPICVREYTLEQWKQLPGGKVYSYPPADGSPETFLEYRHCSCGDTLVIEVGPTAEAFPAAKGAVA